MKKKFSIKILFGQFITVALLAGIAIEGVTMSLFSKKEEEVVLFSEMEGHITLNGEPVKNVKIERRINWKDDIGETDYVTTDDKGYFLLPEIKQMIKLSGFTQFVVGQEIKIETNGNEYFIWSMGKRTKNKYGELNGKPKNFKCELNDDDQPHRLESGLLMTKCKWDSIESIKE